MILLTVPRIRGRGSGLESVVLWYNSESAYCYNNLALPALFASATTNTQRNNTGRAFYEVKSAAIFCHQVAAWVPDRFSNFYLVKSHKIANYSATTEARDKINMIGNRHNFRKILIYVWLNLKTIKFNLIKLAADL